MSEQDDRDEIEDEQDETEGWLSAAEAAKRAGVNLSTLTRWADAGDIQRARKGRTYLYEPGDIDSMIAKRTGSEPAEAVATGAVTISASASMMRAMAAGFDKMVERVLESARVQESAFRAIAEQSQGLIARLDERCSRLEQVNTDMLAAREAYLDGAAERELKGAQVAASEERKTLVFNKLAENAEAIIALGQYLLDDDKPSKKSDEEKGDEECSSRTKE